MPPFSHFFHSKFAFCLLSFQTINTVYWTGNARPHNRLLQNRRSKCRQKQPLIAVVIIKQHDQTLRVNVRRLFLASKFSKIETQSQDAQNCNRTTWTVKVDRVPIRHSRGRQGSRAFGRFSFYGLNTERRKVLVLVGRISARVCCTRTWWIIFIDNGLQMYKQRSISLRIVAPKPDCPKSTSPASAHLNGG